MDEQRESSERPDRVLVLVEQLIHMVAENNRLTADLRAEVSALGARIDGVEQRLSAQLSDMAAQQKQDRALWQAESRHFAHAIGVLERDVAVLKER